MCSLPVYVLKRCEAALVYEHKLANNLDTFGRPFSRIELLRGPFPSTMGTSKIDIVKQRKFDKP